MATTSIPYTSAIEKLQTIAKQRIQGGETVSVSEVVGRICRENCYSPISTPEFDTAAVDGFAVNASSTKEASIFKPLVLCVRGLVEGGGEEEFAEEGGIDSMPSCVEIVTGERFPEFEEGGGMNYDACIRIEDTIDVEGPDPKGGYIQILKPAHQNRNRRRVKVAVVGIGGEGEERVGDGNALYIEAVLEGLCVEVTNLGIVKDDLKEFEGLLLKATTEVAYDVIIATGAVSTTKFDIVKEGIENLGAEICFEKVAIRPGHPVLFATLPSQLRRIPTEGRTVTPPSSPSQDTADSKVPGPAFFNLPGNPLASAICLRFLIIPYLRALHSLDPIPTSIPVMFRSPRNRVSVSKFSNFANMSYWKPNDLTVFWHGRCNAYKEFNISTDQGSNKIRPLLQADCWVEVPAGKDGVKDGDMVETHQMYLQSLGL
ncbi:hypothetical protein G7Y89_g13971 [Cudoniella acicularis]|uniref:molybdopterin adenylyltransferase n=1 Tax=Cudoniella acicularis TaxID=354080 RepID=A0A8H4R780_9HELO|nr:hypothetical protein G7Y89_g13971 [Cudoniella acicularis]